MGIVLRARASLKKKGLFTSSSITIEQVGAALIACTTGTPLEAIAASGKMREGMSIMFHPAGASVDLKADGENVVIDVETSLIGPGYHAFVVSALDNAHSKLGLRWIWDDETGYAENRDFTRLQTTMAGVLRRACADLLKRHEEHGDQADRKLFMRFDFAAIAGPGEVFMPLGSTTVPDLRRWISAGSGDFRKEAEEFYIWWTRGFEGDFYRGIALYWLWNEVRWATPLNEEEVQSLRRVVDWSGEALRRGADFPVLKVSFDELKSLITSKESRPVPHEEGMGHRRRVWNRRFYGWQLSMPGSLQSSVETEKGVTFVFKAPGLDIRASSYTAPSDDPRILAGEFDGEVSLIERKIEQLQQTVTVRNMAKTYPMGTKTEFCILTITSTTPAMRDLGERIGKSLTYVGENG